MKHFHSLLKTEDEDEEINLTPLIDVVFVVLIMFILVAPLVEIDHIQLAPSGKGKKPEMTSFQENKELKIHVYADNTISLNGTPLNIDQLQSHLYQAFHRTPNAHPQVFHDRKAYFETYQSIKNAAENAGFETLDIILSP